MLTQECYLTEEDFCVIKTIYYVNLFKSRFFILIGAPFNFYFESKLFAISCPKVKFKLLFKLLADSILICPVD